MPNAENLTPFSKGDKRASEAGKKGKPGKHLSTHIKEMLNDPDFELKLKDGTILKGRPVEAIIKTAVAKAVSGDMRAFDMLGKYGYGTKLELSNDPDNPIHPILGGVTKEQNVHSDSGDSQDSQAKK